MKNKIKEVLDKQVSLVKPTEKEYKKIEKETELFIKQLREKIKNKKIEADVFIGGSLAKNTLIKKSKYDIDVFVRFSKKYKDNEISNILGRILNGAKKIHGSRDYFQITKKGIIFEVVPVLKIKRPEEAKNVTDLSYFHVSYIEGKIKKNKKLGDEIMLGKSFAYAQNCYGAESYIKGLSGYALELLICYYGSFIRFIKTIKDKKQIVIDPKKFYKSKQETLLELNEAKLQSPIIFVDPTFKERNALAALSPETFEKFKKACKLFLVSPNNKFFEKQNIEEKLRKKHKNLTIIEAKSHKQKGDIAGSKLKKFYRFLTRKLKKSFEIKVSEFEYHEEKNTANFYFVLQQKKEIIIEGPPITAVEHLTKFKKKHKNCFIKKGRSYAREKSQNINKFLENLKKDKALKEMGIKKVALL